MKLKLIQNSYDELRQAYQFSVVHDDMGVGGAQLRLKPTKSDEIPDGFESHIYYEIGPSYRNQGYATETLKQLLKLARDNGLDRVMITVNDDNFASIRVIEKCGGRQVEKARTKNGQRVIRYAIRLGQ